MLSLNYSSFLMYRLYGFTRIIHAHILQNKTICIKYKRFIVYEYNETVYHIISICYVDRSKI